MKDILKYKLETSDSQTLMVPAGAEFLSVIEQGDIPVLYVLGDSRLPIGPTEVLIRGTEYPFEEAPLLNHVFLGTVKTCGGGLVWHVFVERRPT